MYICFHNLRVSWKTYCRPVIGLDGTFLKHSSLQGLILTAVGRDPNNQIYPIAWAVVTSENNDNWQWFIQRLKIDLGLAWVNKSQSFQINIRDRSMKLQSSCQELNIERVLGTSTPIWRSFISLIRCSHCAGVLQVATMRLTMRRI